jgi:hypothetical protein
MSDPIQDNGNNLAGNPTEAATHVTDAGPTES